MAAQTQKEYLAGVDKEIAEKRALIEAIDEELSIPEMQVLLKQLSKFNALWNTLHERQESLEEAMTHLYSDSVRFVQVKIDIIDTIQLSEPGVYFTQLTNMFANTAHGIRGELWSKNISELDNKVSAKRSELLDQHPRLKYCLENKEALTTAISHLETHRAHLAHIGNWRQHCKDLAERERREASKAAEQARVERIVATKTFQDIVLQMQQMADELAADLKRTVEEQL